MPLNASVQAADLRLLAALGLDTDGVVDARAVEAFRQVHAATYTGHPDHLRRAAANLDGALGVFSLGIDWQAVEAVKRAHRPPRPLSQILDEIVDHRRKHEVL